MAVLVLGVVEMLFCLWEGNFVPEATHGNHVLRYFREGRDHLCLSSLFTMFKKSLAKVVPPRALLQHQRSFSTTLPARKVAATNPVKAQEVKVLSPHTFLNSPHRPYASLGLRESIRSSSTSTML